MDQQPDTTDRRGMDTGMEQQHAPEALPVQAAPRRWPPTCRQAVSAAVALVVTSGLVVVASMWVTHPRALGDDSAAPVSIRVETVPGLATHVGRLLVDEDGPVIELSDVRVVLSGDDADAVVTITLCRGVVEPRSDGTFRESVESARGVLTPHCEDAVTLDGRPVMVDTSVDDLIVTVTPGSTGDVHVDALDITYAAGLRSGTERTDLDVVVTAIPEAQAGAWLQRARRR